MNQQGNNKFGADPEGKESHDYLSEIMMVGQVIDNRFRITSEANSGGMSAVYRADDLDYGGNRAVKISLPTSDQSLSKLSFEREERALRDLAHKNIAQYVASGVSDGIYYIAIEWLAGGSLAEKILQKGPVPWVEFYEKTGRPVLEALAYAHRRNWAHRDLKPQNILFNSDETPKIIDFGIARDVTQSQLNQTFFRSGSPPYTPPEADDSYQSTRRDVFSWAAIAVSCLTGEVYKDYESLNSALERLGNKSIPKPDLRAALSLKVSSRQEGANILLADMDQYHLSVLAASTKQISICIQPPSESIKRELIEYYASLPPAEVANFIESDFNSSWAAAYEEDEKALTIVGATIRAVCRVEETALRLLKLTVQSPQRAIELREALSSVPSIKFVCGVDGDFKLARTNIRALVTRIEISDEVSAVRSEEKRKNYWFDCWSDFLREKERIYRTKQLGIRATHVASDGEYFVANVEGEIERDQLGESLVIQTGTGKPLIFSVVDLIADQLILSLRSGARSDIPRRNVLFETNFEAERKSIQKQRTALDDIRTGGAVHPQLGDFLSSPEAVEAVSTSGGIFPEFLSEDKRQVLDKALSVQNILAVNGPPGTGKTTLIAELIGAYLGRFPNSRILLSSQTHVALDNIIVKLVDKGLSEHIVRVVSSGSENVHKVHKAAEALTLEYKVREWCIKAERLSEEFVETYARKVGMNSYDLKAELLGKSFCKTVEQLNALTSERKQIHTRSAEIDEQREETIDKGIIPDREELLVETQNIVLDIEALNEAIDSAGARLSRLKIALNKMEGLGDLFESATGTELTELLNGLVKSDEGRDAILPIVQLHLDWINRLGSERSFHSAVLKEARVIAGTCIGLAGTFAFQTEKFDLCIVDEASKATATETLVPMSRSRCTILVGDPEQLPPFIESESDGAETAFSDDSKKSLLSILLNSLPKENVEELLEQRRMCESIGNMVSEIFYENRLKNVRPDSERIKNIATLYKMPITWISTSRRNFSEQITPEKSFKNEGEAEAILDELRKIARQTRGAKHKTHVAVISAYSAQVNLLKHLVDQHVGTHASFSIEINTVDAFQGRESDICIYSVTRSNDKRQIGFQKEKRRLNVALSRARDALVLVGDAKFCGDLQKRSSFGRVIDYIKSNPDFCQLVEL